MRQGELLGLRWDDVSLGDGRITVRVQRQYLAHQGIVERRTKGYRQDRPVELTDAEVTILREHRTKRRSDWRPARFGETTALCFPVRSGRRSIPATWTGGLPDCWIGLACHTCGFTTCGTRQPRYCCAWTAGFWLPGNDWGTVIPPPPAGITATSSTATNGPALPKPLRPFWASRANRQSRLAKSKGSKAVVKTLKAPGISLGLLYVPYGSRLSLARPGGLEPPTRRLEVGRSDPAELRAHNWSGWGESNPHNDLGRVEPYH